MSLPEQRPLPAFTSLGCYPLLYLTKRGACLCATCAQESLQGSCQADDPPTDADVYWEGPPLDCDGCNQSIESAYGDPEESEVRPE